MESTLVVLIEKNLQGKHYVANRQYICIHAIDCIQATHCIQAKASMHYDLMTTRQRVYLTLE